MPIANSTAKALWANLNTKQDIPRVKKKAIKAIINATNPATPAHLVNREVGAFKR